MGKHKHSKDRMFITASEMKNEWCGKKDPQHVPIAKLPFFCCGLSLMPFETPMCTMEGQIVNIIPFIKKYKKNPMSGQPLKMTDLIRLNFHKNDKGDFHDPISFKVFTEHTKIVAIKTSGNVYCFDTIEELNKKPKFYKDLLTGESFTFRDVITLQDPNNISTRTVKDFDFIKNNLTVPRDQVTQSDELINSNQTSKQIMEKYDIIQKEQDIIRKQVKIDPQDTQSTNYFVKEFYNKNFLLHQSNTINKVSTSVTCSAMDFHRDNALRTLSEAEIRSLFYTEIQKNKQKGYLTINTNLGSLSLIIHCDLVPVVNFQIETCENFLELCEKKYYDRTKFHRLVHDFCLQGGDPTGTGSGGESIFGKPFQTEFHPTLSHDKPGLISMANKGKDTNQSQFFFTLCASPNLDLKHCVFGEVIKGLLQFINDQAVDAWDKPKEDIIIKDVEITQNPYRQFVKEFRIRSFKKMSELNQKYLTHNEQNQILKDIFIESKEIEKKKQNLVDQLFNE